MEKISRNFQGYECPDGHSGMITPHKRLFAPKCNRVLDNGRKCGKRMKWIDINEE